MTKMISKPRMAEVGAVIALIISVEVLIHRLSIPAWPVFLVVIFFLLSKKSRKDVPKFLASGLAGLGASLLSRALLGALSPALGDFAPKMIFLGGFLFALMVFGSKAPVVLNDYAFIYYLVCGATAGYAAPLTVATGVAIGGGVIGGIIGIDALLARVGRGSKRVAQGSKSAAPGLRVPQLGGLLAGLAQSGAKSS